MKKHNIFKVLGLMLTLTMILSYFVPSTTIGYGSVTKGTAVPFGFADTFMNSLTSISAFAGTFVYLIVIGIFYKILIKTGKLNTLVTNTAFKFQKNKSLFIALTVLVLGLITAITGELFSMLVFVPFIIFVMNKLGYNKLTQVATTFGSIILGFSGSMYTFYANQMLGTTVQDNLMYKILIAVVSLISLLIFILVFNKSEQVKIEKVEEKKVLPIKIIMILILLFVILGFTSWNTYFKFDGFDKFLETLKSGKLFKVSVFDALIGQMAQPFGSFQLYNIAALILFFGLLVSAIYKVKIDDLLDSIKEGIYKTLPYAIIAMISYLILVDSYQMFYTIATSILKKVNLSNMAFTSLVSSIMLPDASYATQFTLTILSSSVNAGNNVLLVQIVFQAIYSVCLLLSPTSILILMGLKFNDVTYKSWVKYIYKFFVIVFIIDLIILSIATKAKSLGIIILSILLVILLGTIFYKKSKEKETVKEIKTSKKEEVKKEVKEVKKEETKKNTTKSKNTKTKSNSSKSKGKK